MIEWVQVTETSRFFAERYGVPLRLGRYGRWIPAWGLRLQEFSVSTPAFQGMVTNGWLDSIATWCSEAHDPDETLSAAIAAFRLDGFDGLYKFGVVRAGHLRG